MPSPRRESSKGPTTASSYVLECKLKRAYARLLDQAVAHLHRPADRLAVYVQALGGKLADTQLRGAEKRLQEGMLDVLLKLDTQQQQVIKGLLLDTATPDLATVVAELVRLERNINYRDDDPRLSINDDARLKAAGMGRLSKAIYGEVSDTQRAQMRSDSARLRQEAALREAAKSLLMLGPPLVLEPIRPVARPVLRTRKRGRRKPQPVPRGQYELWPLVGGGVKEGGL